MFQHCSLAFSETASPQQAFPLEIATTKLQVQLSVLAKSEGKSWIAYTVQLGHPQGHN